MLSVTWNVIPLRCVIPSYSTHKISCDLYPTTITVLFPGRAVKTPTGGWIYVLNTTSVRMNWNYGLTFASWYSKRSAKISALVTARPLCNILLVNGTPLSFSFPQDERISCTINDCFRFYLLGILSQWAVW
jgi:hypothetical protein